jgi:hypothetical protein
MNSSLNSDPWTVKGMAITRIYLASIQSATGKITSAGLLRQTKSSVYGMVVTTVLELNIGETPSRFSRKHSITQTEQQDRGARVIKGKAGKGELWSKKNCKTSVWDP